jgi:hypothetical protein
MRFEIYDDTAAPPADHRPVAPLGSLVLEPPDVFVGFPRLLAIDPPPVRAALVTISRDLSDAGELLLIDATDTSSPAIALRTAVAYPIASAGLAHGSAIFLERVQSGWGGNRRLHFGSLSSAGWSEIGTLDVDGANHVLLFDGRTAVIGTLSGVAFVDLTGPAPALLEALETPEPPISATVVSDHLVLGGNSSLMVLDGACPGP